MQRGGFLDVKKARRPTRLAGCDVAEPLSPLSYQLGGTAPMITIHYHMYLTCETCGCLAGSVGFRTGAMRYADAYLAALTQLRNAARNSGWTFLGSCASDYCPGCQRVAARQSLEVEP